jgi:uncharacterized membrane protein
MEQTTTDNGKTAAIVSYITIIGWLISFFALNKPKTSLGSYHVRQSLLLHIVTFGLNIILTIFASFLPFLGTLSLIVFVGYIIFVILGAISASNSEEKPLPVFGEKAQELFKSM